MKCRICPRCGGNHFDRRGTVLQCAYCDTVFVPDGETPEEEYVNFDEIEDPDLQSQILYDTRSERLQAADAAVYRGLAPYLLIPPGVFAFGYGIRGWIQYGFHGGIAILFSGGALFILLGMVLARKKRKRLVSALKTKKEIERSIQIRN